MWVKWKACRLKTCVILKQLYISAGVVFGAIKNDSIYNDATLALKALSAGACAVVADSLFHNLTVLGKNEKACCRHIERTTHDVYCFSAALPGATSSH